MKGRSAAQEPRDLDGRFGSLNAIFRSQRTRSIQRISNEALIAIVVGTRLRGEATPPNPTPHACADAARCEAPA
jgi:hypothetical protein